MKNVSFSMLLLLLVNSLCFTQIQVGQNINGIASRDEAGLGLSISGDGTRVAVGSWQNDDNGNNSGHVRIFENVNNSWVQIGQAVEGENAEDRFGSSISMSENGTRFAVGTSHNSSNGFRAGHSRIFEEVNGIWLQIGQTIEGDTVMDASGVGISISANGTRVGISAPGVDGVNGINSGRTRVYEEVNGNWIQIGQDIDGEDEDDASGTSVSISGDGTRIAIGAQFNDDAGHQAGHTRVFEEVNGTWVQLGQDIDAEAAGDFAGRSVSISADGKRVAIGAHGNDNSNHNSGHTRVYEEINGNWIQIGQDIDGEANEDHSGSVSLSADGKTVAIGAYFNDGNGSNSGHTRIYSEINGFWIQIKEDIDGEWATNYSGQTVSISNDGTRIAVGEPGNNGMFLEEGQARIFKLNGTFGSIYYDNNQNCNRDLFEYGLAKIPIIINPGGYIVETNEEGNWIADLPAGNYTITLDTSKLYKTKCILPQSFTVSNPDDITLVNTQGIYAKYPCPDPDISINMPFIRRCFSEQVIKIQICNSNLGIGPINNPIVLVTLDSLITATSFEIPSTSLGNNQYQFDINSLSPGECFDFWIKATVNCSALLGQALCLQAELLPVTSCVLDSIPNPFPPTVEPCPGEWDESSLAVQGYCDNGTIYFEITNKGVGNMACYSPVTVYVDGTFHLLDSVKLDTQQVATFSFSGNGESWHLEVEQHPNHPGNSQPKATVENCGGSTGQTKINLFAQDDADPIIDIYCGEVTGSYDPNDKTGYPIGLTSDHFIEANQQLQYRIRFQNTGTDTAFTVVIRDTLDTNLNIFSVRSGVASHNYSFRMYGQRVLEWTFNDIMLPDSNINEPLSHGFVLFTVDQLPDLPEGTQINNSAGIYFDFNAPIITNQTLHTIHTPFADPPCTDLTSIISILPGNITGISNVAYAVEITELNQYDTDGSPIIVRVPSDPRLTFTWDPSLTYAAFVNVSNVDWSYSGNNGLFHTFQFSGTLAAGTRTAFGVVSSYDPQGTSGQTTITSTVVPGSGGECAFANNGDSEILIYFD